MGGPELESKDARPVRMRTDESLRSERTNTDLELARRQAAIARKSDAVLDLAQERADAVLSVARETADAGSLASQEVEVERGTADRALAHERTAQAALLKEERGDRQRELAAFLQLERQETDKDLLSERAHSDAAILNRDDFLGMVSHDPRTLLNAITLNERLTNGQRDPISSRANEAQANTAHLDSGLPKRQDLPDPARPRAVSGSASPNTQAPEAQACPRRTVERVACASDLAMR